jgi:hypothetical protein
MKRRAFIILLGGAAVAWSGAARGQQAGKLPTVGFLGTSTPSAWSQWTAAFLHRLRELGWIDGRTVGIEYRWAENRRERFSEIAAEFVRLKVDVIVTAGLGVNAAKQATSVIPNSGAPRRNRTGMILLSRDFESRASTSSARGARHPDYLKCERFSTPNFCDFLVFHNVQALGETG